MTRGGQKLLLLWLRLLRKLGEKTREVDPDLLKVREIQEAVHLSEEAAYSPEELAFYEGYWDAVSTEKTIWSEKEAAARAEGRAEELAEGIDKGIEKGKEEGRREVAIQLLRSGFPIEQVSKASSVSAERLKKLFSENS